MTKLILKGSAPHLNQERKLGEKEVDYIMLNLPFSCNYNCLKCCNRFREYKKGNLKLDLIKKTILKLKGLGARVLVVAGEGEPALNKDFKSIVKFTDEHGLIPYIFTNGSKIDKKLAIFLAEHKASLIINIDSFKASKYDQYVGVKGAFKKLMNNFNYIRKYYRKNIYAGKGKRITSLAVNLVLNNENYGQIPIIKEFCGDEIVFVVNEPINIGSAHKLWGSKYAKTKNLKIKNGVSYPLGTLAPGQECAYMRNGFSIGSDGKALTCAYALDTQGLYGSIAGNDLMVLRRKVMDSVDKFYAEYGKSRCILRHPYYNKFKRITK